MGFIEALHPVNFRRDHPECLIGLKVVWAQFISIYSGYNKTPIYEQARSGFVDCQASKEPSLSYILSMANVAHIHSHPYLHSRMNLYTMNSHIYTTCMYLHTHHTLHIQDGIFPIYVASCKGHAWEIDEMPLQAWSRPADQGGGTFNIVFLTLVVDHLLCSVGFCYLDWKRWIFQKLHLIKSYFLHLLVDRQKDTYMTPNTHSYWLANTQLQKEIVNWWNNIYPNIMQRCFLCTK